MKHKLLYILTFCLISLTAAAEVAEQRELWPNEIRIGWGDQLFESLIWHNPTYIITNQPASNRFTYHENYRHNQHLWIEYQRRHNRWFSYGGMMDVSEVNWKDVTRDGTGKELKRDGGHYFYNLVLMPTIRFTYLHTLYVNLYSGLGVGLDINGGTETNGKGQKTDVGAALNLTVIGVSANYQRWFATLDFGGMYALKDANTIFMASSRIINVSIGARF
ncbi:MAG: hypothetical protein IJS13_10355 [Paludibacteraceae bacterium]|nr:hypothetical protein [Paludibacteraceae bacterium]